MGEVVSLMLLSSALVGMWPALRFQMMWRFGEARHLHAVFVYEVLRMGRMMMASKKNCW